MPFLVKAVVILASLLQATTVLASSKENTRSGPRAPPAPADVWPQTTFPTAKGTDPSTPHETPDLPGQITSSPTEKRPFSILPIGPISSPNLHQGLNTTRTSIAYTPTSSLKTTTRPSSRISL
ncbi:hypothetical protein TruAng_010412 [Truncatella angustata]|nr:hypothetical protein TruAng_010412 [Truncatella angustata]